MGPVRSVGVSAVTQVSSSVGAVGSAGDVVVVRAVEEGGGGGAAEELSRRSAAAALRFLEDFLSPLKDKALMGIAFVREGKVNRIEFKRVGGRFTSFPPVRESLKLRSVGLILNAKPYAERGTLRLLGRVVEMSGTACEDSI